VVVDVPLHDWLDSYLAWMDHDPRLPHGKEQKNQLNIKMPVLELFAPNHHPLYRVANAQQNAKFLARLRNATPLTAQDTIGQPSPSLQQYLDLVSQLQPYKAALLQAHRLTIVAVTYPDKPFCQPQNTALVQFETHAATRNIQVVEIRLHM